MKRVLLAVTATVLGVVALLSFKTHSQVSTAGAPLPSAGLSTSPSSTSPSSTGASAPPNPSTSSTAPSSAPKSASSSPVSAVFVGSAVQTQYGIVQVKVTVSGKRITDVSFAQLTAFDGRSQRINSDAAPILLQETIQAQSAHVDSVSGASYTSAGYVQSLQSALDKAGV